MELRNEIEARRKPEKEGGTTRAVMVFFENSKVLLEFYECEHMEDLKAITRTVTEEISSSEKDGAFLQATMAGAVTLMIREFGRGTDFKCFDSRMIDSGGVHVIQSFFSMEAAEEIQIKGRAARQGAKGSYSMVLNAESLLTSPLNIDASDISFMRSRSKLYSHLDSKRSEAYATTCDRRGDRVLEAESSHFETIDFKECVFSGNMRKALWYLKKWNGVSDPTSVFSSPDASREKFMKKKTERIAKAQFKEQELRQQAKDAACASACTEKDDKEEEVDDEEEYFSATDDTPLAIEDETFYEALGIGLFASRKEVEQAFRNASRSCHPDKCKVRL